MKVVARVVSKGVAFQIGPEIFDRIQLRCVWRKEVELDARIVSNKSLNFLGAMCSKPIPDNEDRPFDVLLELLKKSHDAIGVQVLVSVETEKQTRSLVPFQ